MQQERVLTCQFLQKTMESLLFTFFFTIKSQILATTYFRLWVCYEYMFVKPEILLKKAIVEHWNALEITNTKRLWEENYVPWIAL